MQRLAFSCCALLVLSGAATAKPGVAASTVNLRAEANTTSAVVTKIPTGARIEVGDCDNGWCAVTYRGKSGFSIATALDTTGRPRPRRVLRRLPGVADPDDFEPAAPGSVAPHPYYRSGPYWGGPYWFNRHWSWGWSWGWGDGWHTW
jgi:uncharacterized protein YraI